MGPAVVFENPAVNLYVENVDAFVGFCRDHLGFTETVRVPESGPAKHVELRLGAFTLGLSARSAALEDHGLMLVAGPPTAEIVLWANDADSAYEKLIPAGATGMVPPHGFLSRLRVAWVADPGGNHISLVERRPPGGG